MKVTLKKPFSESCLVIPGAGPNAPYNPRRISDKAFKKLKDNLKKMGLMSTLTWNETTGNLVSGHQRLRALN